MELVVNAVNMTTGEWMRLFWDGDLTLVMQGRNKQGKPGNFQHTFLTGQEVVEQIMVVKRACAYYNMVVL